MTGELDAPLGRKRRTKPRPRTGWPWGRIGAALLALILVGTGAWVVFVDDPSGGRPVAEAPVNIELTANSLATQLSGAPDAAQEPAIVPLTTPGGPSIITLGEADLGTASPADASDDTGARSDLVEMTATGPIPRVAADGIKPYQAYARPSVSMRAAGGRKLIGIVVSGLGLDETTTREAIEALPGTITLAFAPYGGNLDQLARQARADGHELMLEIPLEPFDYPDNDPGPHTLLVEQPPRANIEKLYWLMSRMGGYAGVLNHMGARFTASAADFGPVMEELGMRGLSYLDDGSSNRSVAAQLTRQNSVPYARVAEQLDANPSRAAILNRLDAIRTLADETGQAIGIVSALPVSVRTLAEWAAGLDQDQYLLVPISALTTIQG